MFKKIRHSVFILVSLGAATTAMAADQTVTLSFPGMTCSSCPITIKKALMKVDGVKQVKTDFYKKEAIVIFDDSKTTPAKMSNASGDAGYPSTVKAGM